MNEKKKITNFAKLKEGESLATFGGGTCNVRTWGVKNFNTMYQCMLGSYASCILTPLDTVDDGGGGGGGGMPAIPHPTPDPDF